MSFSSKKSRNGKKYNSENVVMHIHLKLGWCFFTSLKRLLKMMALNRCFQPLSHTFKNNWLVGSLKLFVILKRLMKGTTKQ